MNKFKEKLWSMIDRDNLLQNLEQMVSINSTIGNEAKLAGYIHDRLAELNTEPKFQEVEEGRDNVFGIHEFGGGGPLITLNGHLDTVPVCDGWKEDPFTPRVKGGKLYGLGSLDMKSGLSCALEAYRILTEADIPLSGRIAYSAVVDEEGYSSGAKALLNSKLSNSSAFIIGEPYFGTEGKPVPLGITGKTLYEVTVKGKSAHGFSPQRGINAIEDLAVLLSNLDKIQKKKHPDFGSGNLCTLKVEGGYDKYSVMVPDKSRAIINRLLVPGETIETALEDLEQLAEKLKLASRFEIDNISPSYNPVLQSREEKIFEILGENYELVLGSKPEFGFVKSIMDANVFVNQGNIPTLVFGPRGEGAHESEEYVNIESLLSVTKIYLGIVLDFLA